MTRQSYETKAFRWITIPLFVLILVLAALLIAFGSNGIVLWTVGGAIVTVIAVAIVPQAIGRQLDGRDS